ncbi:MAG TPA: DMT family transporter [Vicinamibacterales bacterium]
MRARLLVLAAALLFSTGGAAIKATTLTAWQVASFRSGVAALALFILLPGSRRRPDRATLLVGVVYGLTMVLFVAANKLTTAANAIYLQSTAPLYILLAAPLLLREPVKRADVVFMLALGAGLAAFFIGEEAPRDSAPNPALGNLLALASGLSWAGTVMGLRWLSGRTKSALATQPALVVGNAFACLLALPAALPVEGSGSDLAIILWLGVVQIGLAYMCLSAGLAGVPALEASLLLLVEPVLNPVWAWVVQGEKPGPWAIAGGTIILVATALRTLHDRRAPA